MMRNKKLGLVAILLVAVLVSSVAAWQVLSTTGAGGQLTVKKAEATVGNAGYIIIGNVGSGKDFSGSGTGSITITNAKELKVTFAITEYVQVEWEAIASGSLKIVEPDVAVLGTISLTSLSTVVVTLGEGVHTIRYDVAGVAAYPANDVPIDFLVTVTVETPP